MTRLTRNTTSTTGVHLLRTHPDAPPNPFQTAQVERLHSMNVVHSDPTCPNVGRFGTLSADVDLGLPTNGCDHCDFPPATGVGYNPNRARLARTLWARVARAVGTPAFVDEHLRDAENAIATGRFATPYWDRRPADARTIVELALMVGEHPLIPQSGEHFTNEILWAAGDPHGHVPDYAAAAQAAAAFAKALGDEQQLTSRWATVATAWADPHPRNAPLGQKVLVAYPLRAGRDMTGVPVGDATECGTLGYATMVTTTIVAESTSTVIVETTLTGYQTIRDTVHIGRGMVAAPTQPQHPDQFTVALAMMDSARVTLADAVGTARAALASTPAA